GQYKELKVSLPGKFNGIQSKFRGFLNQVCLFALLLEKQSKLLDDFDTLVKELEATFGDVDKFRTAANKIRKLIQGSRPDSSYASEFRQISKDSILLNNAISKAEHSRDLNSKRYLNQAPNSLSTPTTEPMQIDAIKYKLLSVKEKEQHCTNNICLYWVFGKRAISVAVRGLWLNQDISLLSKILPPNLSTDTLIFKLCLGLSDEPKVNILALIDSGTLACFLDITFAQKHNISFQKKETPLMIEVIDGCEISLGNVTHETELLSLSSQDHYEELSFNLIPSFHYSVILDLLWLVLYNPTVNWHEQPITFTNLLCKAHHLNPKTQKKANSKQEQLYTVQVFTTLASSSYSTNISIVSEKYQDFNNVFNKNKADKLSVNWQYGCAIDLLSGKQPP
ncbi:7522_t:CDS:2, partial [Cetraspora pellucida]